MSESESKSGQLVVNEMPTLDFKLTTEDIVNLKVLQVEEQLKAKIEECQTKLQELGKVTDTNSIIANEFTDIVDKLKEMGLDVDLNNREDDNENEDEIEYWVEGKKMAIRFHFTLRRPISEAAKKAEQDQLDFGKKQNAILGEIYKLQADLRNMAAVERQAKASLAEWKLKQMGGQAILDKLLG